MPVTFTLKEWEDAPEESTPVDTASLKDFEKRLSKFTEDYEIHWRKPVANHGALLAGGKEDEAGDVRLQEDTNALWWYTGVEWKPVEVADIESELHTHTCSSPTWAISEKVETGSIPGPFIHILTNEEQKLLGVEWKLTKGKFKFKFFINSVAQEFATGAGEPEVKSGAQARNLLVAPKTLADKDELIFAIQTVEEAPEELALSAFIEHIAKAQ